MASIDPSEDPSGDDDKPFSTLKIIRNPLDVLDSEDDESDEFDGDSDVDSNDIEAIQRRLGAFDSDSDSDSDSDLTGGPSDPEKIKKVQEAAFKKSLNESEVDMDLDDDEAAVNGHGANGTKGKDKGKGRALELEDDDDDDSEDEVDLENHEFVLCTLDASKVGQTLHEDHAHMR
jgi:FK506-binding nuclear protein